VAYEERTSFPCARLSFRQIAEGSLPDQLSFVTHLDDATFRTSEPPPPIEIVICSFALHLVQSPSELFALLWELSTKAKWLVLLEPHKKPEVSLYLLSRENLKMKQNCQIKAGWGWTKWDVDRWQGCQMSDKHGELLYDRYCSINLAVREAYTGPRVHCRTYRSLNM
jgi:hypothetical protein